MVLGHGASYTSGRRVMLVSELSDPSGHALAGCREGNGAFSCACSLDSSQGLTNLVPPQSWCSHTCTLVLRLLKGPCISVLPASIPMHVAHLFNPIF